MQTFRAFLISFILLLNVGEGSEKQPLISHISTTDLQSVCVEFKCEGELYAYSRSLDVRIDAENHQFIFPIDTNTRPLSDKIKQLSFSDFENKGYARFTRDYQTFSSFDIYDTKTGTLLGHLTFKYTPSMLSNNKDPFISIEESSFTLPTTDDIFQPVSRPSLSDEDLSKLFKKVNSWNPKALEIIRSPESDIIERCSFIIQFIWFSNPIIKYPPAYVDQLTFIERLEGFTEKKFPLLCGGVGRLFIEIASVLMPDVQLRYINGFECNYPKVLSNIHVNSHIFTEVKKQDQWIYIDPYFQFYFTDRSHRLLGVNEIREIIINHRGEELEPIHFPAKVPNHYIINGKYDMKTIIQEWGLLKCFHWIHCDQFD